MKAGLLALWQAVINLVGTTVLLAGAIAALIYCWVALDDWMDKKN